jgi:cation transport regulator
MPYETLRELPRQVRDNLPKHAKEIYQAAYNSAWEAYDKPSERRGDDSRKETARKVAWSAVKKKYEKNEKGRWVARKL